MSGLLSCPNCGAPAGSGAESTRCEYCGCALATVSCPSCFEPMFAGMQFCPHCGAKGARADAGDGGHALPCPACKTDMHAVTIGAVSMYECSSCASNWVDSETFTAMCANREQRGAVASILGANVGTSPVAPSGSIRYLPCPVCAKLMNRTNFGRRSGVIIDVCKGHGAWFEPRELRNVLAFVDSGGFERARAEDLKRSTDEQRALARAYADAAGAHATPYLSMDTRDTDDGSTLRSALEHLLF